MWAVPSILILRRAKTSPFEISFPVSLSYQKSFLLSCFKRYVSSSSSSRIHRRHFISIFRSLVRLPFSSIFMSNLVRIMFVWLLDSSWMSSWPELIRHTCSWSVFIRKVIWRASENGIRPKSLISWIIDGEVSTRKVNRETISFIHKTWKLCECTQIGNWSEFSQGFYDCVAHAAWGSRVHETCFWSTCSHSRRFYNRFVARPKPTPTTINTVWPSVTVVFMLKSARLLLGKDEDVSKNIPNRIDFLCSFVFLLLGENWNLFEKMQASNRTHVRSLSV